MAAIVPETIINGVDLSPFCDQCSDDDCGRYRLNKPFAEGNYVCATDGRILARVRCDDPKEFVREYKFPRCSEILQGADSLVFTDLPPEKLNPAPKDARGWCLDCDESFYKECPECWGDGSFCDDSDLGGGDYWDDCKKCKGCGSVAIKTCPTCNNECFGNFQCTETLFGETFNTKYVRMIRKLPNVKVAEKGGKLFFKFDGGDGCLMMIERWE